MKEKECFIIIDGNALVHRAYHALPPLTTQDGTIVNAVYGFLLVFFKAIKDLRPDYIAATFDLPAPTFRHKKFKGYKAQRLKTPEDLSRQIPKIKKVLESFKVPIFEKEGFEADDLIATIAKKVSRKQTKPQLEVYILTGDSDIFQLVDDNIRVYFLNKGVKQTVIFDRKAVIEKFELLPEQLVDFKALAGDPSDNIPGVPGIGKKSATDLIKEFGTLENIYNEFGKQTGKIKKTKDRLKRLLEENKEQAFFSKALVETIQDVPISFNVKKCRFGNFDMEKIKIALKKFEFYSLVARLPDLLKKELAEGDDDLNKAGNNQRLF